MSSHVRATRLVRSPNGWGSKPNVMFSHSNKKRNKRLATERKTCERRKRERRERMEQERLERERVEQQLQPELLTHYNPNDIVLAEVAEEAEVLL